MEGEERGGGKGGRREEEEEEEAQVQVSAQRVTSLDSMTLLLINFFSRKYWQTDC